MLLSKAEVRARLKPRDQQRSKVYKADTALKPFAIPLPTVYDVELFVAKVWKSERVRQAYPAIDIGGPPDVKDGRRRRRAAANSVKIMIPRWARSSDVVIHELAHVITQRTYGLKVAGHGWEYCAVYLKLVLYIMGREAHDALKAEMKAQRVRFKPPRQRAPLSPERREHLAGILAAARAKRISNEGPQLLAAMLPRVG